MKSLDDKDMAFLRAVRLHGTATTTQIRTETGFTRGTMRHRYRKLETEGLIETDYADDSQGAGSAPKTATLTHDGEQILRRRGKKNGEERKDKTTLEQLNAIEERLDRLNSRIYLVAREQDAHDEQLEYIYQWIELAELYMKTTRWLFEKQGIDFRAKMNAIEEEGK